ncbi:MAG: hypothetical protein SGARI_000433 [Bacillariaceae sp.]
MLIRFVFLAVAAVAFLPTATEADPPKFAVPDVQCPRTTCCEFDCCSEGTVWDGFLCQPDPASPGWDRTYPLDFDLGCVTRICCENECCANGTMYDGDVGFCVPLVESDSPTASPNADTEEPTTTPTGGGPTPAPTLKECVWIFNLKQLPDKYRNDKCMCEILELAETIGKSSESDDGWKCVLPDPLPEGKTIDDFLVKSDKGVNIEVKELNKAWGVFEGDSGGKEDTIYVDTSKLDAILKLCNDGAANKKDMVILMAVTILHEAAHWADDIHKHPDDNGDTAGEEGSKWEKEVMGGVLNCNNLVGGDPTKFSKLTSDGVKVPDKTKKEWCDAKTWPARD